MNRSERKQYYEARKCGLNPEYAEAVATGVMSLDSALGVMDMDQESGVVPTPHGSDELMFCNDECQVNGGCQECIPFW